MEHLQYLDGQIAERAKRALVLERQLLEVRTELRVYEEMRARLAGTTPTARRPARAGADTDTPTQGARKLGELSKLLVTAAVHAYPRPLTTDEGVKFAVERLGRDVPRNNVRSSLWANSKAELLERVADGVFRATAKGAAMVGETLVERGNTANGSQAVESMRTEGEAGADDDAEQGPARVEQDLLTGASRPSHPLTDERTAP